MEELIRALNIFSLYMKDEYHKDFPIHCEHEVMYVCGVDMKKMDASVVSELVELGFIPGSNDDVEYYWNNFTQEEWEQRWPNLADCFYSYKYGSC